MWGTACGGDSCENIVWGTAMDLENIVWGTADSGENIVWGTNMRSREHRVGHSRRSREHRLGHVGGRGRDLGQQRRRLAALRRSVAPPVNYDATTLDELFLPPVPTTPPLGYVNPTGNTEEVL